MPKRHAAKPSVEQSVARAMNALHRDYVVVGEGRVHAWHAWLIIGIVVGIVAGILFVANSTDGVALSNASSPANAAALPPPPPSPITQNFQDHFNYPDGPFLATDWAVASGAFRIKNMALLNVAAGKSISVVPKLASSDQQASARFVALNTDAAPAFGIVLRYTDAKNYYLAYRQSGGTSVLRISKIVNAAETVLVSRAWPNPVRGVPFTMTASVKGSQLFLSAGGGFSISTNDATFASGSVGLLMSSRVSNAPSVADDFTASVTVITPPSTAVQLTDQLIALSAQARMFAARADPQLTLLLQQMEAITNQLQPIIARDQTNAALAAQISALLIQAEKMQLGDPNLPLVLQSIDNVLLQLRSRLGPTIIIGTAPTVSPAVVPGLPDQELGEFTANVSGEAAVVSQVSFTVRVSSASSNGHTIINLKLIDQQGKLIAGPKDIPNFGASATLTFTDPFVLPVGMSTLHLVGKLGTDFSPGDVIKVETVPMSDNWVASGQTSGMPTALLPSGTISSSGVMVSHGAGISISLSSTPTSQTVIRGATGFTFANLIFDAGISGEDVRVTSAQVDLVASMATDLTNCQLFDGTTALNTGSNIINPTSSNIIAFTLDHNLVVAHGTQKTISLRCDISKSGTGDFAVWALQADNQFGVTGLITGFTATQSITPGQSGKMTFASGGGLSVSLDPSTPAAKLVQAGIDQAVTTLRLSAGSEAIDLKQIGLRLGGSVNPQDLVKLSIWDGATKVGEMYTTNQLQYGVSISGMIIPANGAKVLTIFALPSTIGVNQPGKTGDPLEVDWADSAPINVPMPSTYGIGQSSSQNIYATGGGALGSSMRLVRGFPTINVLIPPSTKLVAQNNFELYRFMVSARTDQTGGGGVGLYKFTYNIVTSGSTLGSTVNIGNLKVYGYNDCTSLTPMAGASADGSLNSGGAMVSQNGNEYAIHFNPINQITTAEAIHIPSGQSRCFIVKGTVSGSMQAGSFLTVVLEGDSGWAGVGPAGFIDQPTPVLSNHFIWSDNATTTSAVGNPDWFNSFIVPGLPSTGATSITFAS